MAGGAPSSPSMYWAPDPQHVYVKARVLGPTANPPVGSPSDLVDVAVVHDDGGNATDNAPTRAVPMSSLISVGADTGPLHDVTDLTLLDRVNAPSLLATLRQRFHHAQVYTAAGSTLLSVNPFRLIDGMYEGPAVDTYLSGSSTPHIFGTTAQCYQRMRRDGTAQSLIICGDSGSGKTEAAKYALQFLAVLSANAAATNVTEHEVAARIQKRVVECNPVLEAFGNARTLRNDNSSRFGKYLQIHMSAGSGEMQDASMSYFMLETSRIVSHSSGERNFHIFYALLGGQPEATLRSTYGLVPRPAAYKFLGGQPGQDAGSAGPAQAHVGDLQEIVDAMEQLGMSGGERQAVLNVLAAILHLGNLEFASDDEGHAVLQTGTHLTWFLKLSTFEDEATRDALIGRRIGQDAHRVYVPVDVDKADSARNALAKEMYARLFRWLIARMNQALQPDSSTAPSNSSFSARPSNARGTTHTIGILDIFGFERFDEYNGFEQICINYCNERLQSIFIERVLSVAEQAVYEREGVPWETITFPDCSPTLAVIDSAPSGVFSMLDDECLIPQGSTQAFFEKVCKAHATSSVFKDDSRKRPLHLTISHYAGDVQYNVGEFLSKNKDRISDDLHDLLEMATSEQVGTIVNSSAAPQEITEEDANSLQTRKKSTKKGKFQAGHFRAQVQHLVTMLNDTSPQFVRCIKPNQRQLPDEFQSPMVFEQLSNAGVLEMVRVRQAGYPIRIPHDTFAYRYRPLGNASATTESIVGTILEDKVDLVESLRGQAAFHLGRTMVFLKDDVYRALESARDLAIARHCIAVQAGTKAYLARLRQKRYYASLGVLQGALSSYAAGRRARNLSRSCLTLQAALQATLHHKQCLKDVAGSKTTSHAVQSPRPASASLVPPTVSWSSVPGLDTIQVTDRVIILVFTTNDIRQIMARLLADHLQPQHVRYRIYNLCLEVDYDISQVPGDQIVQFPFSGHAPCPFQMMIDYCDSMRQWLSTKSSLALIHSKAGKGRSSMMAAAYLLDSGVASTADAALRLFWTRRPDLENESSMTPSQTRYVHYYEEYLSGGRTHDLRRNVCLIGVVLNNIDRTMVPEDNEIWLMIAVQQDDGKVRQKWIRMMTRTATTCTWRLRKVCVLTGDIKVEVLSREKKGKLAKVLVYVCLHAAFVGDCLRFVKADMDKAYKDADHSKFPAGVELVMNFSSSQPTVASAAAPAIDRSSSAHPQPVPDAASDDGSLVHSQLSRPMKSPSMRSGIGLRK